MCAVVLWFNNIHRCFPQCTPCGHMYHAFCGTSVIAELTFVLDESSAQWTSDDFWKNVLVVGEFRTEKGVGISSLSEIDKELVLANIRRPGQLWLPFIHGEVKKVDFAFNIDEPSRKTFTIEFNHDCHPWINIWKCDRSPTTMHVFEVVILVDVGNKYKPIAAYASPTFRIISPKKRPKHEKASVVCTPQMSNANGIVKRSRDMSTSDETDCEETEQSPQYVRYNDIIKADVDHRANYAPIKMEEDVADSVVEY